MRKIIILCSLIILGCNDDSSTKSVEAKDILSIKITHENIAGSPTAKIASDSSLLFNAIAYYKNNSKMDITKEVNWVTSDPAVATVSKTGLAKGITEGITTIMAKYGAIDSNGISLSVTDANVSSLRAGFTSGYSGTLPKGRSYPTVAIATFSDMTRKYVVSDVSWVSSDPSIVSVNENGVLKGIHAGEAEVTANFKNEKSNTLEIKVTDAVITKIQVLPKENHLKSIPIGFTQSMVAVGVFSDGTKQSLLNGITWLSDDESIATVTNEGVVKGIKGGQTTITAQYDNFNSEQLSVTVPAITLSEMEILGGTHYVAKGENLQIFASGTFSDGSKMDISDDVSWFSDDENVAFVDSVGSVHGIGVGQTNILAKFGNIKSEFIVDINRGLSTFNIVKLGAGINSSYTQVVGNRGLLARDDDITLTYQGDNIDVSVSSFVKDIQAEDIGHYFIESKDDEGNIIGFTGYVNVYKSRYGRNESFYTRFFSGYSVPNEAKINSIYRGELLYSTLSSNDEKTDIKTGNIVLNLDESNPSCTVHRDKVYTCGELVAPYGNGFVSILYDEQGRRGGNLFIDFYGDNSEFASGYIFEQGYRGTSDNLDVFLLNKR